MATRLKPPEDRAHDDFGVLLGWSHAQAPHGIQLKVQSTSSETLNSRDIAARTYLMTRNQALILAKYLLDVTDQTLPPRTPRGVWRRMAALFDRR